MVPRSTHGQILLEGRLFVSPSSQVSSDELSGGLSTSWMHGMGVSSGAEGGVVSAGTRSQAVAWSDRACILRAFVSFLALSASRRIVCWLTSDVVRGIVADASCVMHSLLPWCSNTAYDCGSVP